MLGSKHEVVAGEFDRVKAARLFSFESFIYFGLFRRVILLIFVFVGSYRSHGHQFMIEMESYI